MILARHALKELFTPINVRSLRQLHITRTHLRSHDVLAPFRPRPHQPRFSTPTFPASIEEITPEKRSEAFQTSSTQPAGTSFQEVPPPNAPLKGQGHLAVPIPAMKDPPSADERTGKGKVPSELRGEITVQGIVVPPKPRAPGEEGPSTYRLNS